MLTIAGLSVIALVVRILIAMRGGLWRDEALFLSVARLPSWSAVVAYLRLHESHPPLYYAVMRGWLSIAGDSDAAALALPVAIGVLMVPAIYLIGASLFSARVGLLAAALAALSPALSDHSALARPYSLLPLLSLISSFALVRGLQDRWRLAWPVHVACTVAMLYTHNWALLVLGAQWVAALLVVGVVIERGRAKVARPWLGAQLVILVAYLPWVPSLIFQIRNAGHDPLSLGGLVYIALFVVIGIQALAQATILGYSVADGVGFVAAAKSLFMVLPLILVLPEQFLRARGRRAGSSLAAAEATRDASRENMRITLIVLLAVPFAAWVAALLLSSGSNMLMARCLVILAPSLILALAYWFAQPRTGAVKRLSRAAFVSLLASYCVALYELTRTPRSNAREVAAAVAARTESSDLLIIAPEWLASSFNRYYSPAVEQIDFPHPGREEAIDFYRLRERMAQPEALARVKQRIREARLADRRTWLVMEEHDVREPSPEDIARVAALPGSRIVGMVRANQIRWELMSLYGQPDTTVAGESRLKGLETMRVFLFAPQSVSVQ